MKNIADTVQKQSNESCMTSKRMISERNQTIKGECCILVSVCWILGFVMSEIRFVLYIEPLLCCSTINTTRSSENVSQGMIIWHQNYMNVISSSSYFRSDPSTSACCSTSMNFLCALILQTFVSSRQGQKVSSILGHKNHHLCSVFIWCFVHCSKPKCKHQTCKCII